MVAHQFSLAPFGFSISYVREPVAFVASRLIVTTRDGSYIGQFRLAYVQESSSSPDLGSFNHWSDVAIKTLKIEGLKIVSW
jgi:hypothetical protein